MNQNILEGVKCCVCSNADPSRFKVKYSKNGIDIVQCENCSFIFIPPFYRKGVSYTDYKNAEVANQVRKGNNWVKLQRHFLRYKLIRKYKSGGKLFDLGAGWGHFLLAGRMLGYEVSGIEISEQPFLYAKNDLKLPVDHIDFFEMPDSNKFDIITMWDVLEHIDRADTVVEKCARMLQPGGCLIIQVPQIDSYIAKKQGADWGMMGLDHVNYFSKQTLTRLLEKNGFRVKTIRSSFEIKLFIMYTIFPFINKLKKKKNETGSAAVNQGGTNISANRQSFFNRFTSAPKWVLHIFILFHNMVYNTLSALNIGEEMIVVAERIVSEPSSVSTNNS
ncbi:MAG: class I SAM-dependent methyltransferase [Bacteroidia bacterium]|jgi:2-polyprenyl-3-methyl-5-hydroxy-6-metoxy-1,4-benzoquinol methylase|nr:class I SAM-dependent methyltransferase [Bacteroidia bacterium]